MGGRAGQDFTGQDCTDKRACVYHVQYFQCKNWLIEFDDFLRRRIFAALNGKRNKQGQVQIKYSTCKGTPLVRYLARRLCLSCLFDIFVDNFLRH